MATNIARVSRVAPASDPFEAMLSEYIAARDAHQIATDDQDAAYDRMREGLIALGYPNGELPEHVVENPTIYGPRYFRGSYVRQFLRSLWRYRRSLCETRGPLSPEANAFRAFYKSAARKVLATERAYFATRKQFPEWAAANEAVSAAEERMYAAESAIENAPGNTPFAAYVKLLVLFRTRVESSQLADGSFDDGVTIGMTAHELAKLHDVLSILGAALGRHVPLMPKIAEPEAEAA